MRSSHNRVLHVRKALRETTTEWRGCLLERAFNHYWSRVFNYVRVMIVPISLGSNSKIFDLQFRDLFNSGW